MTNAQKIRSMSDEELVGLIRVIYMSEECPLPEVISRLKGAKEE